MFILIVCIAAVIAVWAGRAGSSVGSRHSAVGESSGHEGPPEPASPPLAPDAALASFRRAEPALRIELAAAEPVIEAPVYIAFDEDGRLWVCEMRTYMPDAEGTGELAAANRIVVLEDVDGDGSFEKSTVFLDGLVLPRGVAPCYQKNERGETRLAALVLEPPSLFFCRDTDGDGRADEKVKLLDGFGGRENPEHAGNGLVYGLDNWWHLSQHDLEFRFDGENVETRKTPNHGQWGIARDDLGRFYYTPNSNPLLMDVYPKHYAARNPRQRGSAGMGELIAPDAVVWPAHATPGVNRGYQEEVLRKDGTLTSMTAACGPVIYRAGAFGEDSMGRSFRGDAFICEAAGNLVKRMRLEASGALEVPAARNAYEGREFVASIDERFRPVHTAVGPDGWLYIADMYRGVIQHKTYLTAYLKGQIKDRGLETPINMGRIWRVRREHVETGPGPEVIRKAGPLSKASDDELVGLLEHPDGWWRDTAQRLLVERRAVGAAARLREVARGGSPVVSRLHALWTLEGVDGAAEEDILAAMNDAAPEVRAAGLRLGEKMPAAATALRALALVEDPDTGVRLQAVLSLGERGASGPYERDFAVGLQDALRRHGRDKYVRGAALSGLSGLEWMVLDSLLGDVNWPSASADAPVLNDLADAVLRSTPEERSCLVTQTAWIAAKGDARFRALVDRIRRAQRLDGDDPRPLVIAGEPVQWVALAGRGDDVAAVLEPSLVYFDWPGRPAVERRKRARELTEVEQGLFDRGSWLFKDCAACHQKEGTGSPGLAPALVGSKIALGRPEAFTRALLHGAEGEYELNGMKFPGAMPATQLGSDPDLAAVMTYVRRSWGHTAEPVTPAEVAKVRAETKGRDRAWAREELERMAGRK